MRKVHYVCRMIRRSRCETSASTGKRISVNPMMERTKKSLAIKSINMFTGTKNKRDQLNIYLLNVLGLVVLPITLYLLKK